MLKPFFFNYLKRFNHKKILQRNTDPLELLNQLGLQDDGLDKHPSILFLTKKNDVETDLLGLKLLKNGIGYTKVVEEHIPFAFYHEFDIKKEIYKIQVKNKIIDLSEIKLVILRYFDPRFLHYRHGIYQIFYLQQWYQTFLNLQNILQCKWINKVDNTFDAENRLYQLKLAKEIGFDIPDTVITNNPDVVENFFLRYPDSVLMKVLHHHGIYMKNYSYNFYSTILNKSDLYDIKQFIITPSIFQKKIKKKSEIRVTIIGNKVFACEIISKDKNYIDVHNVKSDNLEFHEIQLDNKIKTSCMNMVDRLGLTVASIDFIIDTKGKIFFLEVNPIGDWNWLEERTSMPMTEAYSQLIMKYSG